MTIGGMTIGGMTEQRHLILALEGPLAAFGAEIVDAYGRVRDWPGASLLTGLFANALGWRRGERAAHDRLQARLRFAVRLDRPGRRLTDNQNARLAIGDRGWTTRGVPEGRDGGAETYNAPHRRFRDYHCDVSVRVAVMLAEPDEAPTLDALAAALVEPARPLFLGRKPCLPARPIFDRWIPAASPLAALAVLPLEFDDDPVVVLPDGPEVARLDPIDVADRRNWLSGLHAGQRRFRRGRLSRLAAGTGP